MERRLVLLAVSVAVAAIAVMSVPLGSADSHASVLPLPPPVGGDPPPEQEQASEFPPLPPDSGTGRRIVYSRAEQRVWIVESDEQVSGSWLVSGRKEMPRPGAYSIFSRSRWSSANGGQVRMEFMLRFARTSGDAIGFHAIPVDRRGRPIQSESELGQPRRRGCVRQARANAEHLWNWAPNGTVVRVTQ